MEEEFEDYQDDEEIPRPLLDLLKLAAQAILSGEMDILHGGLLLYVIAREENFDRVPRFDYLSMLADDAGECDLSESGKFGRSDYRIQQMEERAAELNLPYRDDVLETCRFILTLETEDLVELVIQNEKLNNELEERCKVRRHESLEESLKTMPGVCKTANDLPTIYNWWNSAFTWIENFDSKLSADLSEAVTGFTDFQSEWQIEMYRELGKEVELLPKFEEHAAKYLDVRQKLLAKRESF